MLLLLLRPTVSLSTIKYIPGFSGSLPFKLETGYIGVDENQDVQLFYYFIESEGNPSEDPLVLWLTGGPGCSAFSGLAFEIGPIRFDIVKYNGSLPTMALHPHSWTKVSSIIFLDAPVGTGFSYSRSFQGSKTGDTKFAKQSYEFLRKWLLRHPKFIRNPLYVAGDSHSGRIVPIISSKISAGIEVGHEPPINLKGYVLGNPATDSKFDDNSKVPFAHRMALISDELYQSAKRNCRGEYVEVDKSNVQCAKDLKAIYECTKRVNHAHILEKKCSPISRKLNKEDARYHRYLLEEYDESLFMPVDPQECRYYNNFLCNKWANDISVQKALRVRMGTIKEWIRCNRSLDYEHDAKSFLSYHLRLNKRGYRALIYSGDHDMAIPYLGTQSWIKALNFSVVDEWRPWLVDGQVAGERATQLQNTSLRNVWPCSKDGFLKNLCDHFQALAPEPRSANCLSLVSRALLVAVKMKSLLLPVAGNIEQIKLFVLEFCKQALK
ncbi:hypothetical protein Pint_27865 [Pistacia integerrima]|uniref:Uncharacterized protein n=1 Tax=Pistacia integerrima TaxID=434235 RepID=A0ACC0YTD1_9ROSI|nr:hypothetical protein Pint_27865 [Pistacia integerrima]